jgi:N-acetylglucosaminyldiphosphoundecaprenol N-acetyl-beta-D-mannosaminyltransferase
MQSTRSQGTAGTLPPPQSDVKTPLHGATSSSRLPKKHDVFGVGVSATCYSEAADLIMQAARERKPMLVDHMPVHGLIEASQDPFLKDKINRFDIVAPDGQPVRWALNHFYRAGLHDRVYGPDLMLRLCARAEKEQVGIYLYGSQPQVLERLSATLVQRFPRLRIVGQESPPFRPLTEHEDRETISRINSSGAGLIFLGLGCPKQEHFAYDHRESIQGVQLCVGAAFDFHAGSKKMAPAWMQRNGLEWAFRLMTEPRRLWRRYVRTNSLFLIKCIRHELRNMTRV